MQLWNQAQFLFLRGNKVTFLFIEIGFLFFSVDAFFYLTRKNVAYNLFFAKFSILAKISFSYSKFPMNTPTHTEHMYGGYPLDYKDDHLCSTITMRLLLLTYKLCCKSSNKKGFGKSYYSAEKPIFICHLFS